VLCKDALVAKLQSIADKPSVFYNFASMAGFHRRSETPLSRPPDKQVNLEGIVLPGFSTGSAVFWEINRKTIGTKG
jgi:hypothetical protein